MFRLAPFCVTPTSVILFALPRLLVDLVTNAVADYPELRVAASLPRGADLSVALPHAPGRVAVLSGVRLSDEEIVAVLRRRHDVRVLELLEDGRTAYMYELLPTATPLGTLSPGALVKMLRAPASSRIVRPAR